MSDPADLRRLRLNAALDGELDAANALAFERQLEADPALKAEYCELEAVRDGVRRLAPHEPAPAALAERIRALAEPSPEVIPLAPRARGFASRLPLAAAFAALGFAAGVALMSLRAPGASEGVASGLVSDFARAAVAGQPFDVASSDRHTVKPWLAGRTTISADIVDLAPHGFPLAGGRVAVVDGVAAPTLVYRHNEHLVAVTELPLRLARAAGGVETIDGFHVARWSDANLAYVAVSDMDEPTLAAFVAAFRAAQQPEGDKAD